MTNALETRQRLLATATRLFAARGYYGTSLAAVSAELDLTKQALLYHFGSKEKLYGEVLKAISDRLMREMHSARHQSADAREALEEILVAFYRSLRGPRRDDSQLLMRELLDNKRRVGKRSNWYLKPLLAALNELVRQAAPRRIEANARAFLLVYQMLGAIHYFLISETTLRQMWGSRAYADLEVNFEGELRGLIADRLDGVARRGVATRAGKIRFP